MRTKRRVASGLLAAALLLPVPFSALPMFAQGATSPQTIAGAGPVSARQGVPATRRQLAQHQREERRQLRLLARRLAALLRAHQLLERRLQRVSPFQVVVNFPSLS